MKYNYQARTKDGLIQVGVIEVSSKKEAIGLLQKEGLYVTHLEQREVKPFYFRQVEFFSRARRKDIMIFCRQLSLMLKSGVSLVDSLKSLAVQTNKPIFRDEISQISEDVEGGVYFSEALAKYPGIFSNFFINMIKSGEASGKLSDSLNYLAEHLEREYTLINKIKSGMTYPAFILVVFLGMAAMGIFFVLPSFKETLESLDVELPLLTRIVLSSGDIIKQWWLVGLIVFVLLGIGLWRYFKTEEGKDVIGRISLKLPIIGKLAKKTHLARFTENLSTLILAGLPITQALDIVSNTTGNSIYQKIIEKTQEGVRRGETMSSILEQYPKYVPALVTQMIKVGERTGQLDEALLNVANFYQEEVNRGIDGLVEIIEPILIVVLGGLVAFLMISIIVPVYKGMSSFGF
ncbi:type II secretion system F family protein [Patescibacteria group bacterium]|nr:type II secretion system F family protein [Patescibacteria group bacterium]MBU4022824.1 type II secretion system F family protein [Patescibacteria group bacterium]MBU4078439.1 type II secretion system F family protein [Patescibacteria group bacterium]